MNDITGIAYGVVITIYVQWLFAIARWIVTEFKRKPQTPINKIERFKYRLDHSNI